MIFSFTREQRKSIKEKNIKTMEVKLTKEEYEDLLSYKQKVGEMERTEFVIQETSRGFKGEGIFMSLIGEKELIERIKISTGSLVEMNAKLYVAQQKQKDLEREVEKLERENIELEESRGKYKDKWNYEQKSHNQLKRDYETNYNLLRADYKKVSRMGMFGFKRYQKKMLGYDFIRFNFYY